MRASFALGASGAREAARSGAAVVVVDAFRASTTICVLVSRGVRVRPIASLDEALHAEADYRLGERGSAKAAGFDFGNSPTEVAASDLRPGSAAALSTTNGTRIIQAAHGARAVLTGAFVNAGAVADALHELEPEVAVVGCGWEGKRALEDEFAAGAILHRLAEGGATLDERASSAAGMYRTRAKTDLLKTSAARRLIRLDQRADIEFCLREDTVPVVPRLDGEAFVAAEAGTLLAAAALDGTSTGGGGG